MTTNNLIGYDPLAWMDGETLDETPPLAPVKKATRAKAKAAPVVEELEAKEIVAAEESESDSPVATVDDDAVDNAEASSEEIEIDVTVDKDGDVEITIETDEEVEIEVEIAIETPQTDDDVIDEIVEEVTEMSTEEPEVAVIESEPEGTIEPLIELNSDATIKNIAALYDTIKRALAVHDAIEINASDVTAIDTATLQLLVSLKKDSAQSSKTVDIIYPSARFIESAKLLNLLDVLEVSEV
jgi:ABC-type transporter Mla MlaB component